MCKRIDKILASYGRTTSVLSGSWFLYNVDLATFIKKATGKAVIYTEEYVSPYDNKTLIDISEKPNWVYKGCETDVPVNTLTKAFLGYFSKYAHFSCGQLVANSKDGNVHFYEIHASMTISKYLRSNVDDIVWENVLFCKKVKNGYRYVINLSQIYLKLFKDHNDAIVIAVNDEEKEIERNSSAYKEWKKLVLKRDDNTCQCCGSHEHLEVHHIVPYSVDKEKRIKISNGVTLCKNCHNSAVKGGFHNLYGTWYNTKNQLQKYIDDKRNKLNLPPVNIDDIINKE